AYVDPPIELVARGREIGAYACNERGRRLLPSLGDALTTVGEPTSQGTDRIVVVIQPGDRTFAEEERSRQPTVFTALRAIRDLFASEADPHLGLYGAFGY